MMDNPLRYSAAHGRVIRQDDLTTLGTSSLTLFERAALAGEPKLAAQLVEYFWEEVLRIGDVLTIWLADIFAFRLERAGADDADVEAATLLRGLARFDPSTGDRARVLRHCTAGEADEAIAAAELMRIRYTAIHDGFVAWIQQLQFDIAEAFGEDAVLAQVERTAERVWRPRYAQWFEMTAIDRLRLSVEGMRGHLSGPGRRGDVGIVEEADRYVMVLDPCGSCGILRRGDPESGRPPANPAGNRDPHPWTWNRTGVGWYAVHSPIAMEYLWMRDGGPPLRPLEDCDLDRPCCWFIYKDPTVVRSEHYERQGFAAPG